MEKDRDVISRVCKEELEAKGIQLTFFEVMEKEIGTKKCILDLLSQFEDTKEEKVKELITRFDIAQELEIYRKNK